RFSRDWSSDVCSSDLGDAHEVEINDGGNEASPDSGSWGGEEWSADNDRVVTVEAFWDTNREYNFRCDQSTSDPKDDVEVYLSWRSEERRVGKEGMCGG